MKNNKPSLKTPELVLPGGDLHKTKVALDYGADAVYLGLAKHSLRKGEVKFDTNKIGAAIDMAHRQNKKIYVTFNIFAHEEMLKSVEEDLRLISKKNPDAFIVSDPGIISLAKKVAPKIPVHLSTQANTLNSEALKFWYKNGVKRVVLAREATLSDIKKIKKAAPEMEIEVFVHGAMCISYSGRCLLSSVMTGRSANLGACAQPCRWNYKISLEEEKRPGKYFELEECEQGSYLMNSKDLCLIEHLDDLMLAGVDSLKIEGRNKTDYYVAVTAKTYREGLNLIESGNYTKKEKNRLLNELEKISHRSYTRGFLFEEAKNSETYEKREPIQGNKYVGYILSTQSHKSKVLVKHKIKLNGQYELLTPNKNKPIQVLSIRVDKNAVSEINPGKKNQKAIIEFSEAIPANSFIREI